MNRVIGVLDSGLGGISVLREIAKALPEEDLAYVGDSAFCPYGAKPASILQERVGTLVSFLLEQGAEIIVLACNSATIQAVEWCRARWPEVLFVGMEPGVKPAVALTESGVIGVLATEASLTGDMFARLVARYGKGCQVLTQACPAFVQLVEEGILAGPEVSQAVDDYAGPLVEAGADVLVLGCTHYPFLAEEIARAFPEVRLIDTGAAVARRVEELLPKKNHQSEAKGGVSFWTSGDLATMERLLPKLAPTLTGPMAALEEV